MLCYRELAKNIFHMLFYLLFNHLSVNHDQSRFDSVAVYPLETKCVLKHQDLEMLGLKLNE